MLLVYQDRIIKALLLFGCCTVILGVIRIVTRKRYKIKFFLRAELLMLVIGFVFGVFGYFGKWVDVSKADTKTYSKSALMKDLKQLEKILLNQSPLYYADRESLKQDFELAEKQITGNMTEEEFYRLVNPLVVKVQCGHTNLAISKALQVNRETNAAYLPIEIAVDGKSLYDKKTKDIILSINGTSSEKIVELLLSNISHDGDNLSGAYYILNLYFATMYYEFVEQPDEFIIQYQNSDGTREEKKVLAVYDPKYNVNAWDLRMAQYQDGEYYSSTFTDTTATLRIRVFMEGKQSFSAFLEQFFAKVEETHCSKVIIDVRGNFGGDPCMVKELLSYLITQPYDYFKSDLSLMEKLAGYGNQVTPKSDHIPFQSELVIDGACFSSCAHFAAIYQSMGLGTITGEPTGGGSICTDGSKNIVLYETGLRLHYATQVFEVNAACERTNIVCPDIED